MRLRTKHFILAPLLFAGVLVHMRCSVNKTHTSRKTHQTHTRRDEDHDDPTQKLCDMLNANEVAKFAKEAAASARVQSDSAKAMLKELKSFESHKSKQDFSKNVFDKAKKVTDIAAKSTKHCTLETLKHIKISDPNKKDTMVKNILDILNDYCSAKKVYDTHLDTFSKINAVGSSTSLIKAAIRLTEVTISLIEAAVKYYDAIEVVANVAAGNAMTALPLL